MHFTALLATILMAAPAVVTPAPVASNAGVSAIDDIFARQDATCNPTLSTNPMTRKQQQDHLQRMRELTVEYHAAERSCPSTASVTFGKKGGDKKAKEALRTKCINGYRTCAAKREEANRACIAAGGKSDAGHKQAVQFCKSKASEWERKKVQ